MTIRKNVWYDPGARAWAVGVEDGALLVRLGGYSTPEEASAIGDALVALLSTRGRAGAAGRAAAERAQGQGEGSCPAQTGPPSP